MGRPGRKRKSGIREPNGRIQRPKGDYRDIEAERARAPVVEARARVYGLSVEQARHQMAETVIGRWCLQGEITTRQWEAAEQYHREVRDYSRAMQSPAQSKSALAGGIGGSDGEESNSEIERSIRARTKYEAILACMVGADLVHTGVSDAVATVVLGDQDDRDAVGLVRLGLNELVQLYKIPEQMAKAG